MITQKLGLILKERGKLKKLPAILNHSISLICKNFPEEKMQEFWSMEQFGITDSTTANEDNIVLNKF